MIRFFSEEDFDEIYTKQEAAKFCNEKLNKLIEESPVVYGYMSIKGWFFGESLDTTSTRRARLMFIEPLEKEPCKHKPAMPKVSW